ncbi:hypothetical protein UA08_02974 [Talaromyces atroroseus]|uniref:Aflatoxin regulatory protein domain-containing protein n=1 Tax=Talaromyces atroroseus TaxID=1441469 RepID=A0A225B486_TALAT|nr:hypothetical protein UA08_02974 [Talaromyces atroroseus]OKL62096.1 hypothetical protein UA08_02974 [Talaromyces atroroseus]
MMTMPLLDTTVDTDMPGFDDDVRHHMWNHNLNNLFPIPATLPGPEAGGNANMGDSDINSEASSAGLSRDSGNNNKSSVVDALTKQVMALSTRAMCATRQLDHHADSSTPPLTVNSPVVNEAFEIANALVRIIHGILAANFNSLPASSSLSSSQSSEHESQQPITTDYGLVFLALASHQHVLGLFRAICDSIRWSLGSMAATESDRHQKQALHSNEASSAQFVMVLQLVMHLISRVDRSLRTANWKASSASSEADANGGNFTSMALLSPNLTSSLGFEVGDEGGGGGGSQCVVDLAQNMLRMLPDEHAKIKHVIQRLQKHMEEGF